MTKRCSLQWVNATDGTIGPALQSHAGAIIKGDFYLHGGITSNDASCKTPSNCFYKIQLYPTIGQWMEITSSDSPFLSQHTCLVFKDRYLVFIGGWNGHIRIPGIHTYDTQSNTWLPPALNEPLLTGFPQGAGLSAHSAQIIRSLDDENTFSAIIIGREGSLRSQRKAGNIYLLYGNLIDMDSSQQRMKYVYCEADSSLTVSSRSYHTSTPITPCTLVTIGGCKSNSVDLLRWKIIHNKKKEPCNWPGRLDFPLTSCTVVTSFIKNIEQKQKSDLTQLSPSYQNGWRGHCIIPGVGGLFIGTGEGFNALRHGPLNSAYLLKYTENDSSVKPTIYEIGTIDEPRAYAVSAVCSNDGTAWLHGGLGPQGKTMNTLMKLIRVD
ncbi:unnamed protein product [Schistosoma margrebowiei]|uniref:Kelch domain-containing protein 9 n=2 Tax=Schistosoma margrebowiei TaxID=48269 RepID=A0AA85APR6_9TREM|nr:unnamed protein product [Schistosoma margrebowiei]